jgi:SAM-dependent methyltransferase
MTDPYTFEYYRAHQQGSLESAREVVPTLLELLQPKSVLDVGCGTGAWLRVFQDNGVEEICGVDAESVPRTDLLIAAAQFVPTDLGEGLRVDRIFDLTMCLEVSEHLPAEHSDHFVSALTKTSAAIVFSAAIPGQRGFRHVNEQWPDYWASRFHSHDYVCLDCLRSRFWNNTKIKFWFRQNMLLFIRRLDMDRFPQLAEAYRCAAGPPLPLVHPELFQRSRARERSTS